MAQIQETLNSGKLTEQQQIELQAQYDALQQEKLLTTAETNAELAALNKQFIKQPKEDNIQLANNVTSTFTSTLDSVSQIITAIQSGIDTQNEEGFEKNKKLQIANATISMLQGIVNAISSSMALPQPWGAIQAGINAATVATVGGIQIANIKKQTFDGSGGSSGNLNGVGATPNISMADMLPINYTKNVLTDTETAELNKGNKVYVLESDISETQNEVAVKEANSSF